MEQLTMEFPMVTFVFCSEDKNVLDGIKKAYDDAVKNNNSDTFAKYLHNSNVKVGSVEFVNEKNGSMYILNCSDNGE